jgi:hypothetical protein
MVLLAFAVAVVGFAANARADGDPASDYLLTQQVFLPSDATASPTSQRQLLGVVQAANRAGFAIRVAIIPSSYDLGSVTELWRQPRTYARFLSLELSFAYTHRLLVVMPNGLGFNLPNQPAAAAYRLLATVAIPSTNAGLVTAAQTAVKRLAAAAGINVTVPARLPTVPQGGSGGAVVIVPALAVIAVALAGLIVLRRRRTRA